MKLGVEAPWRYAKEFTALTDFMFVEAGVFETNRQYRHVCQQLVYSRKPGVKLEVYLDNTPFIGKTLPMRDLINIARTLSANVIVVPDVLGDTDQTLRNASMCVDTIKAFGARPMGVLQGQSMDDYLRCLEGFKQLKVDFIGIPYHSIDRPLWLETHLEKTYRYDSEMSAIPHPIGVHILGLKNPYDILWFRQFGCIESVDTSLPIGSATLNLDFKRGEFHSAPFDPDMKLSTKQLQLAKRNTRTLSDLCHQKPVVPRL